MIYLLNKSNKIIVRCYKKNYDDTELQKDTIPRKHHGGVHVSRASILACVFANLYKKHSASPIIETQEDIDLLRIGLIFHDSARKGDGKDIWDRDSALNYYNYMVQELGVSVDKAKLFAESLANKDYVKGSEYFILDTDNLSWNSVTDNREKNILSKLAHDADCIEIMRAVDDFKWEYLDFYKEFISDNARNDLSHLLIAHRHFIEITGDKRNDIDFTKKTSLELSEKCYSEIEEILLNCTSKTLNALKKLYAGGILLKKEKLTKLDLYDKRPFDPSKPITDENITRAMNEGRAFGRIIANCYEQNEYYLKGTETYAQFEIRKDIRIPNTSSGKHGNPERSASMIGFGGGLIGGVGFLILDPAIEDICQVTKKDCGTGYGKKRALLNDWTRQNLITKTKAEGLKEAQWILKSGANHVPARAINDLAFSEVTLNVKTKNIKAIIINKEDHFRYKPNQDLLVDFDSRKFEAIYLQQEYLKKTGILLPIKIYSPNKHGIQSYEYDVKEILRLFKSLFLKQIDNNKDNIPDNLEQFMNQFSSLKSIFEAYSDTLKHSILRELNKDESMNFEIAMDDFYKQTLRDIKIENKKDYIYIKQKIIQKINFENIKTLKDLYDYMTMLQRNSSTLNDEIKFKIKEKFDNLKAKKNMNPYDYEILFKIHAKPYMQSIIGDFSIKDDANEFLKSIKFTDEFGLLKDGERDRLTAFLKKINDANNLSDFSTEYILREDDYLYFLTIKDYQGLTLLINILLNIDVKEIERILDILFLKLSKNKLVDILNLKDKSGNTILMLAAYNGYSEIVEKILEQIPLNKLFEVINEKNNAEFTALIIAVHKGYSKTVEKILEKVPKDKLFDVINARYIFEYRILIIAAQNGYSSVVEKILHYVPPDKLFEVINATNVIGQTALMIGSLNGHSQVVKILTKFQPNKSFTV